MTKGNKKQYIANVKVMNYLLQAIPNDIYNSVDACKNAKEMWERIKRLMHGSAITTLVRHSRLMDEFDKFAAKEGESLDSVYEMLTTLVHIMDRNNVRAITVAINTKFLNCLQPEWSKYVTMVRHNQTDKVVSYDVLYDSLVQFEPHVLASRAKIPSFYCMRTRSQARNRNRRQQQITPVIVEEPEIPMADNCTMAQMLQAPTEGYEDAIVIPEINANFELKHGLINLVQNK
ncbi:hypothetical protein Tco_0480330 [Tanacetum coccineum]